MDASWTLAIDSRGLTAPSIHVVVLEGPDRGRWARSDEGRLVVGSAEGASLVLTDPRVSRFHLDVEATAEGVRVRDLDSATGTRLGAVVVREVVLDAPADLALGASRIRVGVDATDPLPLSRAPAFHGLVGASPAMRALYARLSRAAAGDAGVLLTGEVGVGKASSARALHAASARAAGPFEVVTCAGLPAAVVEAELFGARRSGAAEREGALVRASGGTLLLDEPGELALALQQKLLLALEERAVRVPGQREPQAVDVRVVSTSSRDLRRLVNRGLLRPELHARLAGTMVDVPPLRERLEDIPSLVPTLLGQIAEDRGLQAELVVDDDLLSELSRHDWPGNVRALRDHLEGWIVLAEAPSLPPRGSVPPPSSFEAFSSLPLRQARHGVLAAFERAYVERLLAAAGGDVVEAARRAGVHAGELRALWRRRGG